MTCSSIGERWKTHRKLLDPAFHSKILEQFIEVFNNNVNILVENFSKHLNGPEFEIRQYVTLCALDNICETVMGVKVNAQSNSDSEYVQAVYKMEEFLFKRIMSPWLHPDFIFNLSSLGREQKKCLEVLHGMTRGVIRMRRKEMQTQSEHKEEHTENNLGSKRRLAFLDLLIEKSHDIPSLTDEIIREEVDTFMAAGHESVATAMEWILWLLSKHQDEQEKAAQELNEIFRESERDPTPQDFQNMTYLEKVIKEAERLYPSPLVFGRTLVQDLSLGDYVLPGGTNVMLTPYCIHRNPEQFPDPEKFDPERFSPENIARRHPYAYVPFSLGPRNCIGKRFATLELKVTISQILRKFKLLPDSNGPEEIALVPGFVVKSRKELRIKIKPRREINMCSEK